MSTSAAPAIPPDRTDPGLKGRFGLMMFLQYFVQGAYLPVVMEYVEKGLEFSPTEMGTFKAALSVGPLIAPFILGQIVDRHLATERVLAFSHLVAGGLMLGIYVLAQNWTPDFYWLMVAMGVFYSALYVPSMMLTNSLTFHHLKDRESEFPLIRLWGTIGFILPAWLVEMVFLKGLSGPVLHERRGVILLVSAVAGFVMAAYCFTLPHTPPAESDRKDLAPGKVIGLLRRRDFLTLVLVSLLIALAHSYFFFWNSPFLRAVLDRGGVEGAWEQRIASIGQIFEIVVMAGLGFALKRYGFKTTMLVGAAAYMLRCLIFAFAIASDAPFAAIMSWVCIGEALHGLCFGCFLATAYMYVDRVASADVKGSMQTFYGTFVVGLGMFLGGFAGGAAGEVFTTEKGQPTVREMIGIGTQAGLEFRRDRRDGRVEEQVRDWPAVWLSGAALSAVALAAFWLTFPRREDAEPIHHG